jgi:hypothetical protein
MVVKSVVSIGVVVSCLIAADGAKAAEVRLAGCAVPQHGQVITPVAKPGEENSGAAAWRMSIAQHVSGGLRISAQAEGIDVQKTVFASGEFSVSLRSGRDLVTLVGNQARVKLSRGGRTVLFELNDPNNDATARASILVAGSQAIRAFRAALGRMSLAVRQSPQGAAVAIIDLLLNVAQGDPGAPDRFLPAQPATDNLAAASVGGSCYDEWKAEVQAAWNEYEACYNDFNWWSGGREVCAFLWTIQVEAAWFKMWGCAAFPFNTH